MSTPSTLYISVINLSETDQKVFQVALHLLEDEGIHCEVLPLQDERGHLVVIDMEAEHSDNILKSLKPGQVKLVMSSAHMTGTNLVSILKPIRVDSFKDVLSKVCNKMYSQLGNNVTPQKSSATEISSQGSDFAVFMRQVMQVSEHKQSCVIHLQNRQDLMIDGERQMLLSREPFEDIINSALSTFERANIEILPGKINPVDTGNASMTALPGFLWELAVRSSESILPVELNQSTKVNLKAWPNFTRHGFKPEHLKIAALLAKQAVSIDAIAQQTALAPGLVQQFVNGCYAVGLLNLNAPTSGKKQSKVENKQVSQEKKTLFKRLAYKLGFA